MKRKWMTFTAGMLLGFLLAIGVAYAQQAGTFKLTTDTSGNIISMQVPAKQAEIVEGNDLAIRIQGRRGDRIVGTLMTKVDGQWVEVEFATQNVYVKAK